jgi:hypothetical protein
MLDARIKVLERKYEINIGLLHCEGSYFRVRERDSSFSYLILDSSCPGVEDSDDAPFTHHALLVYFGGAEVDVALAGVFSVSVFFPPCLVDCLRLLWSVAPFDCFHLGIGRGHLIFQHIV